MKAQTAIRIQCDSRAEAKELALRLEADEYRVSRRWRRVTAWKESYREVERPAAAAVLQSRRATA